MATILSVSGSPSATSRTARLLRHLDDRLRAQGHDVIPFDVRTLPPADFRHTAIVEATALFERADGIMIGTPVYKAAYSGLLKALLDLLPQYALAGKTVLPLATGGTTAHVLAIDYALRPVLNSMGPAHITPGWFTLGKDITEDDDGTLTVAPGAAGVLAQVTDQFSLALGGRPTLRRRREPAMTHVIADDAERILPRAELDELSASGLLGITVPRSHGGAEVSARTLGEVVRLRSAADAGIGQIPQHHFFFVMRVFERFRKRRAIDLMRVATAVCS